MATPPSLHLIPWGDKLIVYRPLKRLAFLANQSMARLAANVAERPDGPHADIPTDVMSFLEGVGFLGSDPAPDEPSPGKQPFLPTVAVILLTTACNLRCVYCYASGGQPKAGQNVPLPWAKEVIAQTCRNAQEAGQDHFTLGFHGGGEPTLPIQSFLELADFARCQPLPCLITVATNGYWTDEVRGQVLDAVDSVSLSLDGTRRVQDSQRPTAGGNGSFAEVMRTVREMDGRGMAYGIRLTVTARSLPHLQEGVEHLCAHSGCSTFQVEPAFDHGRAHAEGLALDADKDFATAFLAAHDHARARGRHLYYSGARPWVLTSRFCLAPDQALILCHDGSLSACYEVWSGEHALAAQFMMGAIDGQGLPRVDQEARGRFLRRIARRRELCADCFCYWHCAGDCPSKSFSPGGRGHLQFGSRCRLNRELTRELLIRYMAEGGGVWQGGPMEGKPFQMLGAWHMRFWGRGALL